MIIVRHGRRVEIGCAKKLNLIYPPPLALTAQWWYLHWMLYTSVPVTLDELDDSGGTCVLKQS